MIYFVVLTLKCLIDEVDHQLGPGVPKVVKSSENFGYFYRIRSDFYLYVYNRYLLRYPSEKCATLKKFIHVRITIEIA